MRHPLLAATNIQIPRGRCGNRRMRGVFSFAIVVAGYPRPANQRSERLILRRRFSGLAALSGSCLILLTAGACSPTVRVEAPSEPITINLNIKLDADVRVRLEEVAKEDVENNPIF